ncbi:MAG: 4Fe-4S dicluster domain-containing protein [Slackia sp.]|nr:4Fe-4S dicluster domain-containing protein [Slackia sp.]
MAKQYGFYVDTARCVDCWACEIACKQWNGIKAGGIARRKVHEVTEGTFPDVKRTFVSMSCMHCAEPACAAVCPAGAITKRDEDGIVVVDKEKCIGCHYCFFACPFGVPQYDENGMDKCDCCIGNGVTPGDTPHCVATCPTQALHFGTMEELAEKVGDKKVKQMVSSDGTPSFIAS